MMLRQPSPFKPKNRPGASPRPRPSWTTARHRRCGRLFLNAAGCGSSARTACGSRSIPVKAVLGTPLVSRRRSGAGCIIEQAKVSFAKLLKEQGAAKIDPVAAGGAPAVAPVEAIIPREALGGQHDAAERRVRPQETQQTAAKGVGGGAAAGGGGAAARRRRLQTNRFLAGFAAKVDGGGEADGGGEGDDAGGKSRGKALWSKAKGVVTTTRMKVSAEEAERIRRSKLVPFSRRYILLRWTIGWIIMIAIFIILMLFNFMYGVKFGGADATAILISWGAACIQTFLIVEPSEVLGLVLLPSVAENKYVAWCRTNLKEYGFI